MDIKLEYNLVYYTYLDKLRRSGITNMFGAAPFLLESFDIEDIHMARKILTSWQNSFADRRKAGETGD